LAFAQAVNLLPARPRDRHSGLRQNRLAKDPSQKEMKISIGLLLLFLVCTSIYGRKDSKPSKSAKASTKSTKKSLRYIHYEAPVPVHVAEFGE
jgi:hypothetical protein